jgi:RING-box protein 1
MAIVIKKWEARCFWTIKDGQNVCGICRNLLTLPCITCESQRTDDKCCVCFGNCNHAFHHHCISQYFKKGKTTCPFCAVEFNIVKFV